MIEIVNSIPNTVVLELVTKEKGGKELGKGGWRRMGSTFVWLGFS
jgi:hypothetical protein